MKSQTEAEKRQQWLTLQIGLQTQMEILQASTTWSQVCNWQTVVTMLDSFFLWVMLLKQATISSFFLQETNNQLDLVQMQWSECKTESAYFTMHFIPEKNYHATNKPTKRLEAPLCKETGHKLMINEQKTPQILIQYWYHMYVHVFLL